jgi:hypothetical protein
MEVATGANISVAVTAPMKSPSVLISCGKAQIADELDKKPASNTAAIEPKSQ